MRDGRYKQISDMGFWKIVSGTEKQRVISRKAANQSE